MSEAEEQYDIAIIGAGVAGLSAAYFLSEHSRVAVFEQETDIAYHSSSRSAAMFIQGYENPTVCRLTNDSEAFFLNPYGASRDETDDVVALLKPRGGLTCAGEDQLEQLNRHFRQWTDLCPELEEIGPAQACEIAPILRKSWVKGALYDPSWRSIDTHALLMIFQKGLKHRGGNIITNAPVTSLTYREGSWHIKAGDRQWRAHTTVNAAGAWANQVGQLAGLSPLPLTPLRRTAVIVPLDQTLNHMPLVHTALEDIYFKPESPGLMISPADETPSEAMDAYPLELDVAIAMDRFQTLSAHPVSHLLSQWAGLRTYAKDRAPVVGFDPEAKDFFWLAGQGGFGVQTSPALGQLTAACICQGETPSDDIDVARWRS